MAGCSAKRSSYDIPCFWRWAKYGISVPLLPVEVFQSTAVTLPITVPSSAVISVPLLNDSPKPAKLLREIVVVSPFSTLEVSNTTSIPHAVGAVFLSFIEI